MLRKHIRDALERHGHHKLVDAFDQTGDMQRKVIQQLVAVLDAEIERQRVEHVSWNFQALRAEVEIAFAEELKPRRQVTQWYPCAPPLVQTWARVVRDGAEVYVEMHHEDGKVHRPDAGFANTLARELAKIDSLFTEEA